MDAEKKMNCTAIVLAAGQGKRMGTKIQKQYLNIEGRPVLYYSLKVFQEASFIDDICLVVGAGQEEYCRKEIVDKYGLSKVRYIVAGGEERYHSVWNGLQMIAEDGYVFIHSDRELMTGDIVTVNITESNEYDLIGEINNEFTK